MNKKIVTFLSAISLTLGLGSLMGCNSSSEVKVYLETGTIRESNISIVDLDELTYDDFVSKVNNQDSFMLAIYEQSCGCWNDFIGVIDEFINTTHVDVYYMNVSKLINKERYGLNVTRSNMPSIALFDRGSLVVQAVNSSKVNKDYKMFTTYSVFIEFVERFVYYPKMYYVERGVLDQYILNNKIFNLYVGRNECPDCSRIYEDVLKPWSNKTKEVTEPLYIFDIQKYWRRPSDEDYQSYLDIKKEYGLTLDGNPDFGYGDGAVPTFQRRQGSKITDMSVYLNDSYDAEKQVINSYFTAERVAKMAYLAGAEIKTTLDGMAFNGSWKETKREFYEKYHYPLARLFISTYII